MLKAFFDASRTQVQTGIYLIGGYVADEAFWTDFEKQWTDNLTEWGIPDFHLTECLARRGAFNRFDNHRAQLCALNFSVIIKNARPDAIWSGVVDEQWAALDASSGFRARYPSPYQFIFHDALWQLSRWGNNHARGEMIAPIFDMDADPRTLQPIFDELKQSPFYGNLMGSLTFGSRKQFIPIQAADILAGEAQRYWFDFEYPINQRILGWRNIFDNAVPKGSSGGLWTPETLKRAADAFDACGNPFNWPNSSSARSLPS